VPGGDHLVEPPPHMAPAEGKPDGAGIGKRTVTGIAIDLQHACGAAEARGGALGLTGE
jgi:hypothetical protein